MVNRNIIEYYVQKSIIETIKCPTNTNKARRIGKSCTVEKVTESFGDITATKEVIYSYDNDLKLTFDGGQSTIKSIEYDGETYNYYNQIGDSFSNSKNNPVNKFDYLKKELSQTENGQSINTSTNTINDWEKLKTYSDEFASDNGMILNNDLRNNQDITNTKGFVWENHDWFVSLQKRTKIDHENYATLRITKNLHDNEDITIPIIKDKGHTSASAGGNIRNLSYMFGGTRSMDNYNFDKDSWKTVTLIKKGSGVKGLYLGGAINESRFNGKHGDWESEVNYTPNQKFRRVMIDESHKLIVQIPDGIARK